ncbi:hypothetical protein BJX64DRAFT_148190 [Aspergillus heterothallicus]
MFPRVSDRVQRRRRRFAGNRRPQSAACRLGFANPPRRQALWIPWPSLGVAFEGINADHWLRSRVLVAESEMENHVFPEMTSVSLPIPGFYLRHRFQAATRTFREPARHHQLIQPRPGTCSFCREI